ncbi:hypothetical protein [Devosia salina]|uniref:Uncharacterized protein n=1 Tax=Devosia salina TaxID=2860336 RepID=A0ABX8W956_9HYPH|nr:hypothetical protein [Devosia salina]QYO75328.1 hypothetical protein K1X15_11770 [Devosia salina]
MPTITAALAAFERHLGFPQSRSRTIARRLQEAGILPLGSSGSKPEINDDGFIALFLALAGDTTLHEAAPRVDRLFAMTPGGASLEGAPASIPTARRSLLDLIETALVDEDLPTAIEVVSNFDELAITWPGEIVERFQPTGAIAGHWQVTSHRRACIVTGSAFAKAIRATFSRI